MYYGLKTMNYPPLSSTQIEGGFWGHWQIVNQQATIPAMYKQMADTGRIEAFKLNWKPGMPNPPHIFWDSDVAKWIEAARLECAAEHVAQVLGLSLSRAPSGPASK